VEASVDVREGHVPQACLLAGVRGQDSPLDETACLGDGSGGIRGELDGVAGVPLRDQHPRTVDGVGQRDVDSPEEAVCLPGCLVGGAAQLEPGVLKRGRARPTSGIS
jgi:hypothetical protein